MIKISILIPSLESRKELLSNLVCNLISQMGSIKKIDSFVDTGCRVLVLQSNDVEVVACIDNKSISTGFKRNVLLRLASGTWVSYVDDDDSISDEYCSEILKATESNADTFAINGCMLTDGQNWIQWFLSKDNDNVTSSNNGVAFYLRKTNHLSPTKRELALLAGFTDRSNAEDRDYSEALNQHLKTEFVIDKPLYTYNFSTQNKEYT